jgi:hypothetical protein
VDSWVELVQPVFGLFGLENKWVGFASKGNILRRSGSAPFEPTSSVGTLLLARQRGAVVGEASAVARGGIGVARTGEASSHIHLPSKSNNELGWTYRINQT